MVQCNKMYGWLSCCWWLMEHWIYSGWRNSSCTHLKALLILHKTGPLERHTMSVSHPSKMDEDTNFHNIYHGISIKSPFHKLSCGVYVDLTLQVVQVLQSLEVSVWYKIFTDCSTKMVYSYTRYSKCIFLWENVLCALLISMDYLSLTLMR